MTPEIQHPTSITPAAAGVGLQRWNSPIPYLFGGLALVLAVVALALVILACSYRNPFSNNKSEKAVHVLQPEIEPRIVVIMAGETNPTHLAKPIAALRRADEQV